MDNPVDLYDSHYGNSESPVYEAVRLETFGEDFGQTSWISAVECDEFARWLGLAAGQRVLEVACGTGGTALRLVERTRVTAVGVDVSEAAVRAADTRAKNLGVRGRAEFRVADANDTLPFPDGSFDALFCNDAINHLRDRPRVLLDWHRVLRPGGRFLYTDPIVVTGCLSNAEIAARSSIGFFLFTPEGVNEALVRAAGFRLSIAADVTEGVSTTSRRWHDARFRRRAALIAIEGEARFEEFQRFLATVHTLAFERRLSRYCYVGEKGDRAV